MPAKSAQPRLSEREAPPVLLVIAVIVLIIALGAGGFYAYNGGWKTASQQNETYKHEFLPLIAAKHGDREALDAENNLRKQRGQAPLEMPKDTKRSASDRHEKLMELQKQLQGRTGQ